MTRDPMIIVAAALLGICVGFIGGMLLGQARTGEGYFYATAYGCGFTDGQALIHSGAKPHSIDRICEDYRYLATKGRFGQLNR